MATFPVAPSCKARTATSTARPVIGGANGYGTVFKINSTGIDVHAASLLFGRDFKHGRVPTHPPGLVQGADGQFYGTAEQGGRNRLTERRSGHLRRELYPAAHVLGLRWRKSLCRLVLGSERQLLRDDTEWRSERLRHGFKMASTGTVTVLHSFLNATSDGEGPDRVWCKALTANFYGYNLTAGGTYGYGMIVKLITIAGPFRPL